MRQFYKKIMACSLVAFVVAISGCSAPKSGEDPAGKTTEDREASGKLSVSPGQLQWATKRS